jgi:hypothetical protein
MNWLPEHKFSLYLSHNEHRHDKKTIKQYYKKNWFVNDEEWQKAIATDSVWTLSWWPEKYGGEHTIRASTLEAIQTRLKASKWP